MDNLVVLDCEVYPNYFLVCFKNIDNDKTVSIETCGDNVYLDDNQRKKLHTIMSKRTTVGYNSNNYDLPVILYALQGKTTTEIYELSKHIITESSPSWMTMKHFNLILPESYDHIDIMEPSPGIRVSLKLLGGRMHSQRLQELPYDPLKPLTDKQMDEVRDYCFNDLSTTIDLYRNIEDRIQLRIDMGKRYGMDFRSMSDQKIAETIIKSELEKKLCKRLYKPELPKSFTFKYKIPDFIKFESKQLNDLLEIIRGINFELDDRGSVQLPKELKSLKIAIGDSVYKLGVGGLHSTEKKQTIEPEGDERLCEVDAASLYPYIIVTQGLYPNTLGPVFLNTYRNILKERLEAKKNGDKLVDASLKLACNSVFGKLGSKYSSLYAPDMLLQVTLSGQLCFLMLVEMFENAGLKVVSGNTDGVVVIITDEVKYLDIIKQWEKATSLILEETEYKGLYSRDVNNYVAVKTYGIKGKGFLAEPSLMKNPQNYICAHAVKEFLFNNTPVTDTIKNCTDITMFLTIRSVTGGAVWRDNYLGKVVRFYMSVDGDTITYAKNSNKVAKSDGSKPLMDLPDTFPTDIDYDRYIEEAYKMLDDIGYMEL